jgi:hypothetical protein
MEMQILLAVKRLGSDVIFEHVEDHQDTKYPGQPLPWAANQRCDEIVSAHLEAATNPIPAVTFLPASQVSVSVGRHTVTHHIPTQLRTFTGLPGLWAHYCKHHEWESPAIFDLIDWPMHHSATLSTTFLKCLFVTIWINSLLPFQKQQHLFKQSPLASCPSGYGCTVKDWRDLTRCPHPQRMQALCEFLLILITVTERWTLDPSLRRVLLHLLAPATSSPAVSVNIRHPNYSMLLTTQQSIGVDSLLFGFFSTEWVRLQDRYLRGHSLPCSQNEVTRAISSLILTLHEQCHTVWLLRIQHLHGTDPNNITSYKHLHLLAQIQELYDTIPHMMQHDHDLLAFPMECRRLQSTATLTTFYRQVKPIVAQSIKDAQKLRQNFRRINDHFQPIRRLIPAALFVVILGR